MRDSLTLAGYPVFSPYWSPAGEPYPWRVQTWAEWAEVDGVAVRVELAGG